MMRQNHGAPGCFQVRDFIGNGLKGKHNSFSFILTAKLWIRMPTVLDIPPASRGVLNFKMFGVPVQIQPWFWVTTLVLGWSQDSLTTLVWVAVVLVSILVHEFGHVAAYRAFGSQGAVLLYSWGGLAIPAREIRGTLQRIVVALAGPFAGFSLAAITVVAAMNLGAQIDFGVHMMIVPSLSALFSRETYNDHIYTVIAVNDLLFVNFYWGLMNLLPVTPLDGSHISRAILERGSPLHWRRPWMLLSAGVAFAIAGVALYSRSFYVAIMFLLLGIGSLQTLDQGR
jgi:stage IV sporulation protein FB